MSLIDIVPNEKPARKFPKKLVVFGLLSVVLAMGGAVGALISLNGSGSQTSELGTGLIGTVACDSNITYHPDVSYYNDGASSKTTITRIDISDISSNCAGKDFLFTIRDANGVPVAVSNDASGREITSVHFYFQPFTGADGSVDINGVFKNQFRLLGPDATGPNYTDGLVTVTAIHGLEPTGTPIPDGWNGDQPSLYWKLSDASNDVSLVFNPAPLDSGGGSINGFANPINSTTFTLETSDHSNS